MKIVFWLLGLLASTIFVWFAIGSPCNLDYLKENAESKWRKQGFEIVDYEGHQWSFGGFGTTYGGAKCWHRLKKIPDNGITYSGFLRRWGDEITVYGPNALDAIRPN